MPAIADFPYISKPLHLLNDMKINSRNSKQGLFVNFDACRLTSNVLLHVEDSQDLRTRLTDDNSCH